MSSEISKGFRYNTTDIDETEKLAEKILPGPEIVIF